MKARLTVILCAAPLATGCALFATSPATKTPLKETLSKAASTSIERAAKACLAQRGWKPDPVGGLAEGAIVVSAVNKEKARVTVYVQPPEMSPRVTGGPDYDDPFWKCLGPEIQNPTEPKPEPAEE